MTVDLSPYSSVESALICSIVTPSSSIYFGSTYFSDYYKDIVYDGNTYKAMGSLVSITDTKNEMNPSGYNLTISVNPNVNDLVSNYLPGFINKKIIGAKVAIRRLVFDPVTGTPLNINDNSIGRFFGRIINYSVDETYDYNAKVSNPIINLECASNIAVLQKTKNGRRTNAEDFRGAVDYCMQRVTTIAKQPINFGDKK